MATGRCSYSWYACKSSWMMWPSVNMLVSWGKRQTRVFAIRVATTVSYPWDRKKTRGLYNPRLRQIRQNLLNTRHSAVRYEIKNREKSNRDAIMRKLVCYFFYISFKFFVRVQLTLQSARYNAYRDGVSFDDCEPLISLVMCRKSKSSLTSSLHSRDFTFVSAQ